MGRRFTFLLARALLGGLAVVQAAGFVFAQQPAVSKSESQMRCPSRQEVEELLASGSSLLEQNRFKEAAEAFHSKRYLSCDYRVSLLYAAALEGSGNLPAAVDALAEAHRHWPSNLSLATSLARYYLRLGKMARAAEVLQSGKPSVSTPLQELQVMAMVYLETHDLARAKAIASLAYQAYPSEETLLFAANVLQLQGRFMDVVALLERQRSSYPDSTPFLITLAESESDGMMYGQAKKDLTRATEISPGSYPAHYLLGNVMAKTGQLEEAIREYQIAISLSPQQPRTYVQLGLAFLKQNDEARARQYFERALSVDDQYGPAYCELGKMQMRANSFQEASVNLSRAIQYDPSLQESYYLLVQSYARLGERDKSQAVLAQWNAYKASHKLKPAALNAENPLLDTPANAGGEQPSASSDPH